MKAPTLAQHTAGAGRRLAHLAGLAAKTEETERRILAAAEDRLAAVEAQLAQLRPRAVIDPAAGDRFAALMTERGQLHTVAAQARETLGS